MKRCSLCCILFIACGIGCLPLFSAGKAEPKPAAETARKKPEPATEPAPAAEPDAGATEQKDTADAGGIVTPAAETADKQEDSPAETGKAADTSFASIQNNGMTVAEDNKWYYEHFDRYGRSAFAVEYEDGKEIKRTLWAYTEAAHHPREKRTFLNGTEEIIRYDDAGRVLVMEVYDEKKTLVSKTENTYTDAGNLIEQQVTAGKNTDRFVWDFAGGKAVSQTKYRNGKKTAFIELHSTPRIVHLYADDKEVLVMEEQ
ncbi:MAG: hypothetical protein P1P65_01955 [Treponema sp.]